VKSSDESYSIHIADWHAAHALMREYVTVLHMHKSELSKRLGPGYDFPDRRGPTVNAAVNGEFIMRW
jgi:hypothetical protein